MTHPAFHLGQAHLRVARATDNLPAVVDFYRLGLGLEVIAEFKDHDGYDGVMLGKKGWHYHLEFTHAKSHRAGRAPTQENLLVFYLPDDTAWEAAVARLETRGHKPVPSLNPFWDQSGKTFEDPDGYRVVLQKGEWWAGA